MLLSISFLGDLIKHKEMQLDDEKRNNQTEKFPFVEKSSIKWNRELRKRTIEDKQILLDNRNGIFWRERDI